MSLVGDIMASGVKTYNSNIYRKTSDTAYSSTVQSTARCLYWQGSSAKSLVRESIRTTIDGVLLFDPDVITVSQIVDPDSKGAKIELVDIDIGGAVNHTGGYSTGALTIAVDEFDESKRPICLKDTFTIAGETGLPVHTITAYAPAIGSPKATLTFTPGLASDVADDAAINLTPILYRLAVIYPDDVALQGEVIQVPVKVI